MPSDDPSHKFTPSASSVTSQSSIGDPQSHTQATSTDRPGTQDALRGQGNSAAVLSIPRDQVAPASDPEQSRNETLSKEDRSNVAGQKENNKEREIPNYVTTGKDEGAATGPTEGRVSFRPTKLRSFDTKADNHLLGTSQVAQPPKDNDKNLVEAGTTMAGDADAYGGVSRCFVFLRFLPVSADSQFPNADAFSQLRNTA